MKEDEDAGDVPFREVVGSLMWIANQTRPDISKCCAGGGETLSRAEEKSLEGGSEDAQLSS